MVDVVLVHGAWHGAWCWERMLPAMVGSGHRCHAVTLTGLGDRAHLASPDIVPDLHARDVVSFVETARLDRVVLVGHSYGSLVATGAADRLEGKVAGFVSLDGYVPDRSGEAVLDMVDDRRRAFIEGLAAREGDGWRIPPVGFETFTDDAGDIAMLKARTTPQPLETFRQGTTLARPPLSGVPVRVFVRCRRYPNARFDRQVETLGADRAWRVLDLDAFHNLMMTDPATTAGIVADAATAARRGR